MPIEKSRIKFQRRKETGEIIGLVSRRPTDRKLRGVDEKSPYGKKVCVLSEDLKGRVDPGVLYEVELKEMHNKNGYVVVSAVPIRFRAVVETVVVPRSIYQVTVTFGHKVIYFDPKDGKTISSNSIDGVLKVLKGRKDLEDIEKVLENFKTAANALLDRMVADGYTLCRQ